MCLNVFGPGLCRACENSIIQMKATQMYFSGGEAHYFNVFEDFGALIVERACENYIIRIRFREIRTCPLGKSNIPVFLQASGP